MAWMGSVTEPPFFLTSAPTAVYMWHVDTAAALRRLARWCTGTPITVHMVIQETLICVHLAVKPKRLAQPCPCTVAPRSLPCRRSNASLLTEQDTCACLPLLSTIRSTRHAVACAHTHIYIYQQQRHGALCRVSKGHRERGTREATCSGAYPIW